MSNRNNVVSGLWLHLAGVLAALTMLLTGMVTTATANAANNADGDVTLDFNGISVSGADKVIKGRLDADGWVPDLSDDDPTNVNTLDPLYSYFYGWNTKADGTGDWYIFTGHRNNPAGVLNGVTVDKAPKLANGKLKYPQGGKLYAQSDTFKDYYDFYEKGIFNPSQPKVRRDEVKNLTFTTNGWNGRFRGAVYVSACQSNWKTAGRWEDQCLNYDGSAFQGDGWKVLYDTLLYTDNGGASEPYSLGYGANPDKLNKLLDAAYANSKIKYLNVYAYPYNNEVAPVQIGSVELDRSEAPAPDTEAPVFSGVSDVTVYQGATFDPLSGVSAKDAVDGDVTQNITVAPSAVDTSKLGETTLTYTVKDKAGNTATATRVVTVKAVPDTTVPDTTVPDTTAPVFSGVSDVTVYQGAAFDPLSGVSAEDAVDGDVTSSITVSPSAVDTTKLGKVSLTYTVSDNAGNTATATRVVTVKATAPDADKDLTTDTQDTDLVKPSTAKPGETLTLQLPAEYAGKQGDVYVYSTPTVLAVDATVSDQGTLEVTLPTSLAAGKHRIVFKPYDATLPLVWDSFTVPASQQNPQPTQPNTDLVAGTKKPITKKSLAVTGSSVAPIGIAALVLASVAGTALVLRRYCTAERV
ncbi:hypothetical protein D2E25_2031 [Bifidobacterium goeldii]|uniref:Pesticidal crystal protein Cry22Aa Ig-like domain-containing protein n=1 Tax=Bifidobacterium goeldii TaxID=2306975 RepID=A0A430FC34_9BIFI|nr:immunoglobulin-like domain-containing protein [Bifidobacterium goeldii]RSX50405.1 hypothetical protein D2E25_2031 [Bifidobacterium goeldii]